MLQIKKCATGVLGALLPFVLGCSSAESHDPGGGAASASETGTDVRALGVTYEEPPLYTFDLGDGRGVYLWELKPGLINYSESAPVGSPLPHLTHDLTGRVAEIFQALKPGESMPGVLAQAQDRQDVRLAALYAEGNLAPRPSRETVVERSEVVSSPGVAIQEDTSLPLVAKDAWHEWFEDNLCRGDVLLKWPHIGMLNWCGLHKGGGGTWRFDDKAELFATVMSYEGRVGFKLTVWWDGGGANVKLAWVTAGFYTSWDFHDDSLNDKHDYEFAITEAIGDSYHRAVVSTYNFCPRPETCAPAGLDHCLCRAQE
jgi:hypothetical protein